MKFNFIKRNVFISLFVGAVLILASCQQDEPFGPTPLPQVPGTGQDFSVEIINSTYQPDELTIPVGATVVWTQHDDVLHTVTADDGSFNSGFLQLGAVFTHTFDQPGQYVYHCELHGEPGGEGMSGLIIVNGN
jgi:plastocyanin